MTTLATVLQAELKAIDTTIAAANIRRNAIMVLLDQPPAPTFTATEAEVQAVQPKPLNTKVKAAVKSVKVKRSRPTLRTDISPETIRAVREMAAQGWESQSFIADHFNLGRSTVSNIIRRKSWFATIE